MVYKNNCALPCPAVQGRAGQGGAALKSKENTLMFLYIYVD
jgi:hypothetical protein